MNYSDANLPALVADLRALVTELRARIVLLEKEVAKLREENAQLRRNSSNSSKPPSSDNPATKKKPAQKPSGRRKGGQPGRPFFQREMLPADYEKVLRPTHCKWCRRSLNGPACEQEVLQQIEIPSTSHIVTNFIRETVVCKHCQHKTRAALNSTRKVGFVGPRLASVIGTMTGKYRQSKREVVHLLHDLFGVKISLGSVCNTERRISKALCQPVRELLAAVQHSKNVHFDETGWRQSNRLSWLWLGATKQMAVFAAVRSRGRKVAMALAGSEFSGIAVTDRWSAYDFLPAEQRQLCWAHIQRDFQSWEDLGGKGAIYATRLLEVSKKLFHDWRNFCSGQISQQKWKQLAGAHRVICTKNLRLAYWYGRSKIRGMAKRILRDEKNLWLFTVRDGVEPTNNHAERIIRPAVLWRKGCFGNDSSAGSQYAARILSAAATLRLQGRNLPDFLSDALLQHAAGQTVSPSLLPLPA